MVPAPVLMMPFAPADVIPPKLTTLPAPKSNVFTAPPRFMTLPVAVSLKLMNTPVPVVNVDALADELTGLKMSELRRRAEKAGATAPEMEEVFDKPEEAKTQTYIDLIIKCELAAAASAAAVASAFAASASAVAAAAAASSAATVAVSAAAISTSVAPAAAATATASAAAVAAASASATAASASAVAVSASAAAASA